MGAEESGEVCFPGIELQLREVERVLGVGGAGSGTTNVLPVTGLHLKWLKR